MSFIGVQCYQATSLKGCISFLRLDLTALRGLDNLHEGLISPYLPVVHNNAYHCLAVMVCDLALVKLYIYIYCIELVFPLSLGLQAVVIYIHV